jgi:biopolymer transport protein ExbB
MSVLFILGQIVQNNTVENIQSSGQLTLLDLLFKGGLFIVPLVIFSVFTVYIIIDKFLLIRKMEKLDAYQVSEIHNMLSKGDLEPAINELKHTGQSAYSFIFLPALYRVGQPIEEIERAVETSVSIYRTKMARNLSYLGLIARLSPMIGFIGSIAGIVKIFYGISVTDNISIGVISGGLYEKMISSGLGLIVGVVAYAGYHLLSGRVESFIDKIEIEAFDLISVIQGVPKHK